MTISTEIDGNLLAEAMRISGLNTEAAVLNLALKEYLRKNELKKILKYRGKNIWEGDIEEMRTVR